MRRRLIRVGVTLLGVIFVLLAVCLFVRGGRARRNGLTCIKNLREVELAKDKWWEAEGPRLLGSNLTPAEIADIRPSSADLLPYLKDSPTMEDVNDCSCPCGGTYVLGVLNESTSCTYTGTFRWRGEDWYHSIMYSVEARGFRDSVRARGFLQREDYCQEPPCTNPMSTNILNLKSSP